MAIRLYGFKGRERDFVGGTIRGRDRDWGIVSLGGLKEATQGANMEVLRRIRYLNCSSILLQLPVPASLRSFSSSATFALVARWKGSGGLGWSGKRGEERGTGNGVLVLSLWRLKGWELREFDVVGAPKITKDELQLLGSIIDMFCQRNVPSHDELTRSCQDSRFTT